MHRVGIVGAGVAGTGAAYAIADASPDLDVSVFEAIDRVGGRAATRTRDGYVYDHGANYVKPDDDRVARLITEALDTDGLVDVTEPVYTFDESGTVSPGRDGDAHKWTYESGLVELTRRLLDRTDATVEFETTIVRPDRVDDGWVLQARSGAPYGPFDAIVLTPPAPRAAALVASANWGADVRDRLATELESVSYRRIFSAALSYGFELDRPYYALVNTDKRHDVGWLSREECKRGHVPEGETLLIVQASHDWSVAHGRDPPTANADRLASQAARIVGEDRLERPTWADYRLWETALPEGSVEDDVVEAASTHGLHLAGDAVAGEGRIHAALSSGLDAGERVLADAV